MSTITKSARMPTFLILGAQKAGTTSLYHYLGQHPEIFMSPVKEPQYFSLGDLEIGPNMNHEGWVLTREAYGKLFDGVRTEKAVGEASTTYLSSARAARRIRRLLPRAGMIAVLRDPADRAYSNYVFNRKQLLERAPTVDRALELEDERLAIGMGLHYSYRDRGFYHAQLSEYYRLFDRRQLRVFLYDDLEADPRAMLREIFAFLEVDDGFEADMSLRYNISGAPRNKLAEKLLRLAQPVRAPLERWLPPRLLSRVGKVMLQQEDQAASVRQALIEVYRNDILKLQDLIDRDLSAWLR